MAVVTPGFPLLRSRVSGAPSAPRGRRVASAIAVLGIVALSAAIAGCRRPASPEATLAKTLASEDEVAAAAAAQHFASLAPVEKEAVVRYLARELGKMPFGLANAAGGLRRIAPDAVPILIALRAQPDFRGTADAALQNMGPAATAALPPLEQSLDGADAQARISAAGAIAWIAPERAAEVVARTAERDPAAALAVGFQLRYAPAADRAAPGLGALLGDARPRVRELAAAALAELGARAASQAAALERAAVDPDARVRRQAERALRAAGLPGAPPAAAATPAAG